MCSVKILNQAKGFQCCVLNQECDSACLGVGRREGDEGGEVEVEDKGAWGGWGQGIE